MKFVKWIFISLFCLPFILAIGASCFNSCTEEGCNPVDYARITDVEYKAVVVDEPGSMGKIVVTERLTFDIHAFSRNNLFWELWRDLCEDTSSMKPRRRSTTWRSAMPMRFPARRKKS